METVNKTENKDRGIILLIHISLPFQENMFDVEFNEAQFCTLKQTEGSGLLS